MVRNPVSVYLWGSILVFTVTHVVVILIPGFTAMSALIDVR